MVDQTDAELICRFDDDDISLPWRITWCVDGLTQSGADYFAPGQFWATNDENPRNPKTSYEGGAYAQSMFKRDVFLEVGGYRQESFGEDRRIEWIFQEQGKRIVRKKIPQHEACYLYRWGTGSHHLSGFGKEGRGWERIGATPVVEGTFELHPHWQEDYVERVRRTMLKNGHKIP